MIVPVKVPTICRSAAVVESRSVAEVAEVEGRSVAVEGRSVAVVESRSAVAMAVEGRSVVVESRSAVAVAVEGRSVEVVEVAEVVSRPDRCVVMINGGSSVAGWMAGWVKVMVP